MILLIFIILISLSVIFILSASAFNSSLHGIIGYTFLFLVGLSLLGNGLTYPDGFTNNETYFYDGANINYTTTEQVPLLTTWKDGNTHLIGWLFAVSGFLGFTLVMFTLGTEKFTAPGSGVRGRLK